jgi:hypothetical protein
VDHAALVVQNSHFNDPINDAYARRTNFQPGAGLVRRAKSSMMATESSLSSAPPKSIQQCVFPRCGCNWIWIHSLADDLKPIRFVLANMDSNTILEISSPIVIESDVVRVKAHSFNEYQARIHVLQIEFR